MNTPTKYGLLALSLIGLATAGIASAHGVLGPWGKAIDTCSDDMTVGDCRVALAEARQDKELERCAASFDAAFCQARAALLQQQADERDALLATYGVDALVKFRPQSVSAERPADVCTDDMTVQDCRSAYEDARQARLLAACTQSHGQEFCEQWLDLQGTQQAEMQDLYTDHGYEPVGPGPGGPPFGHGRGHGPMRHGPHGPWGR